jgi:iron complex transport system ATP-binding protein
MSTAPLVELLEVVVERNGFRILDLERLVIPVGQNVVLFGPNGSGKSTLLKLLMKFFYPSSVENRAGTIKILGQEAWNVWELRTRLGFVSSEIDHHFTSGRSGRLAPLDAVLTGFESSELELDTSSITPERIESASRWLDFFEIDAHCTKRVGWLSTGERRRVMLARAMVHGAKSLLLDEPTAGLDIVAREKLLLKLEEMSRSGIQLVLVTHHLEEIIEPISRCILLKSGRLLHDSTVEACITSQWMNTLFDAPVNISKVGKRYSACLPLL